MATTDGNGSNASQRRDASTARLNRVPETKDAPSLDAEAARRGDRLGAMRFRRSVFALALSVAPFFGVACGGEEPPTNDDGNGGSAGDASSTGGRTSGGSGGAPGAVVDGCDAPSGDGTDVASTIDADETWTTSGSPYRVTQNVYLTATLTLEPCTIVELSAGANIFVGNDPVAASIVAHGDSTTNDDGETVERRIIFQRGEAEAWTSLLVDVGSTLDFEFVTLEGGGSPSGPYGAIVAYGDDAFGAATEMLRLRDVDIVGSTTYGVNLQTRAAFTDDSRNLRILDSGSEEAPYPIYLEAGAAYSLPAGLIAEGNERDEVLVHPFSNLLGDTFPSRGVPLRVSQQLRVHPDPADSGTATLTIEAGTEVRFDVGAGSGLIFGTDEDSLGRIVAEGTASAPILLTSAQEAPAPGDWVGLYFRNTPTTGNSMRFVTIRYAGAESATNGFGCGPGDNDGSILLITDAPVEPFLENCTIEDGGGEAQLVLGWTDDENPSTTAQAFAATNTFASSPSCSVSLPVDTNDQCPGNDDEPDCL